MLRMSKDYVEQQNMPLTEVPILMQIAVIVAGGLGHQAKSNILLHIYKIMGVYHIMERLLIISSFASAPLYGLILAMSILNHKFVYKTIDKDYKRHKHFQNEDFNL